MYLDEYYPPDDVVDEYRTNSGKLRLAIRCNKCMKWMKPTDIWSMEYDGTFRRVYECPVCGGTVCLYVE